MYWIFYPTFLMFGLKSCYAHIFQSFEQLLKLVNMGKTDGVVSAHLTHFYMTRDSKVVCVRIKFTIDKNTSSLNSC